MAHRKTARASAQSPQAPHRAYSTWSELAFLGRCGPLISSSTRTGKGRVFKVCHVIDEFTCQHLALRVERRMGAVDVIEMLEPMGHPRCCVPITGLNSSPQPWGAGPASTTRSKHSYPRASFGWAGSWSPYTTACVMNSWRTTCSRTWTTPAP